MEVKQIEGVRIAANETLVIVPPSPMPDAVIARLKHYAKERDINIMVLPHNCKVYIKEHGNAT